MPWSIQELRDLVGLHFDPTRAMRCWSSLQSIDQRQHFAGYHFREYKRLIQSRFPAGRTITQELDAILRFTDEAWTNHLTEREASAHVAACLQNMHCVSDTLAQVIYLALGPRLPRLDALGERNASVGGVSRVLDEMPRCDAIAGKLRELCAHPEFVYLTDIVNHGKHRRIVGLEITVNSDEGPLVSPRLELAEFAHDGKKYAARDVEGFLNDEYARQSHLVVDIGLEINKALQ